jgi:hypothetical protein
MFEGNRYRNKRRFDIWIEQDNYICNEIKQVEKERIEGYLGGSHKDNFDESLRLLSADYSHKRGFFSDLRFSNTIRIAYGFLSHS